MSIFLQASPAFGGQRYGPFDGAIHLGSNEGFCAMVLDAGQGIFPLHLTIEPTEDGWFLATPAATEGVVIVTTPGGARKRITTPVPIASGHVVTLGTPDGPSFTLIAPPPRTAVPLGGFSPVARELARQVEARAQANQPWLQELSALWRRLQTGQLVSPTFLVGASFVLFSTLGVAALSCVGLLTWVFVAFGH